MPRTCLWKSQGRPSLKKSAATWSACLLPYDSVTPGFLVETKALNCKTALRLLGLFWNSDKREGGGFA